jgi:Xaa-Pro aminopeptidase
VAASEFERRTAAVAAGLAERRLDALFVAFSPNLRYLSGFTGDNACLLVTPAKTLLFTDPRFAIQAAEEVACAVKIARGPLTDAANQAIARLGPRRIGYEPTRMTCAQLDALKSRLPMRAALHPVEGWIEELRMVKDSVETGCIRRSVLVCSKAFEQAAARVRSSMKERDLAAELEYRMRRLGAEKPSFDTIVACGARSALPHAQPTSATFQKGGLVVVDMGAMVDGYASDMTRMLHLGVPGAKVKRTYAAVLEAQLAAIDAVRAGVPAGRVDAAARRVLARHGLADAFVHSTGHGLGLEIHEPPRIGRRQRTRLEAGMAITIEPGVYLEGWGGIRIEDTVVVTGTGCEVLTPTPKELLVA